MCSDLEFISNSNLIELCFTSYILLSIMLTMCPCILCLNDNHIFICWLSVEFVTFFADLFIQNVALVTSLLMCANKKTMSHELSLSEDERPTSTRGRNARRLCPHCNQSVTIKTFRSHKQLYYNQVGSIMLMN